MLYKVRSLGLQGISGYEVTAECDLASGLPNFDIVGLPDTAVKEARERVRSAIKNNGYPFPVGRITVNLAPANLRKSGTIYDLPICVGILAASGQLTWSDPHCAFVGELSLSGTLRPVVGMDKEEIVQIARKIGTFETSILPYEDCCTVFTPRHPRLRPLPGEVEFAEEKLDIQALIQAAVDSIERVQV